MSVNHTQPAVIRLTECAELRPRRRGGGDEMASVTQEQGEKRGKGYSEEPEERKKRKYCYCDYYIAVTIKMTIVVLLQMLELSR